MSVMLNELVWQIERFCFKVMKYMSGHKCVNKQFYGNCLDIDAVSMRLGCTHSK